jgi:hypothetical protein
MRSCAALLVVENVRCLNHNFNNHRARRRGEVVRANAGNRT